MYPLLGGLAAIPSTAFPQLIQGANTLQFLGNDNPSGTFNRFVDAYLGPDKTEIQNTTFDGARLTTSAFQLDEEVSILSFMNHTEQIEGLIGAIPQTWLDASATVQPMVIGGVFPQGVNGTEFWDNPSADSLSANYSGFITTQSGSTWYGNLSMNESTTFSADTLTASTITAMSITATNVVSSTLSVTGNATIGGTLNMSNNRITNVADGINPADAVNVRQLEKSQQESRAGISSVAAIAGIPSLSNSDDGVLGVGVGTYKGESAIAFGASKRLSDTTTFKFGVGTSSSSGDVTGSFGIGIKW